MLELLKKMFQNYWKKAAVIIAIGTGYSLWLWHDASIEPAVLISNIFSVISLIFLVVALFGTMHNVHALSFFAYGFTYLNQLLRNAKDHERLPGETSKDYAEFIQEYSHWTSVPMSYMCFVLFTVLSLLVWFLF